MPQPPPPPSLCNLTFSPNPVTGGNPSTGTVTLCAAAPTGGATVNLSSNDSHALVPLSVSVLAGQTTATFTVNTNLPGGQVNATITASTAAGPFKGTLTILPLGPPIISLVPTSLQFTTNVGANPPSQTLQVTNAGSGALGWTATATTQSGGNWLSVNPTTGVAPSTLTVTVNSASLAAGNYIGSITITALASANASNSPQVLQVVLAVGTPTFPPQGVVGGASFSGKPVPYSIVSLFGTNLSARTETATSLPLPTTLAGTQVLVNNAAAALFYVSPSQINFHWPPDVFGPTAAIVVVSGGIRSSQVQVAVELQAPGIFTAIPGGEGQGAVLNQDFSPNSATNPAAGGSVILIYATGLGATNPPVGPGQPGGTSPLNLTVMTPVVLINGVQAQVLFSGLAPGFVGLYQVNARVPVGTAAGSAVPLQIQIGGKSSNTVTIAVR